MSTDKTNPSFFSAHMSTLSEKVIHHKQELAWAQIWSSFPRQTPVCRRRSSLGSRGYRAGFQTASSESESCRLEGLKGHNQRRGEAFTRVLESTKRSPPIEVAQGKRTLILDFILEKCVLCFGGETKLETGYMEHTEVQENSEEDASSSF